MHPQVWKCSGHYDLFHDCMVDCRESKRRYRYDQVHGPLGRGQGAAGLRGHRGLGRRRRCRTPLQKALKFFNLRAKQADELEWDGAAGDA